jgi:hypothetical protein
MNLQRTALAALVSIVALMASAAPALAGGTDKFDEGMKPILESYLKIHSALAGDSFAGVAAAAKTIAKASGKLDAASVDGKHKAHYKDLPGKLKKAAEAVSASKDIKSAREAFKGLSRPMAMWAEMSKPAGVDVAFCSMAKGSWLQKKGGILNPYYGKSMLTCGEIVTVGR